MARRIKARAGALLAIGAAAITVSGCTGTGRTIDQVPLQAEARENLRAYLDRPNPKVFAFAPSTGKSWYAWGYATVDQTKEVALKGCEALGNPCELVAVNDQIVWAPSPDKPSPGVVNLPRPTYRTTTRLNFRSAAGTTSSVLAVLPEGTSVDVVSVSDDWTMVRLADGREGWVARRYLTSSDGAGARGEGAAATSTGVEPVSGLTPAELTTLDTKAEAGDADAQFDLGNRYMHGLGVERDYARGRIWLERAAKQGHALAAYELGQTYELGRGVPVDRNEALRWYKLSAAAGHDAGSPSPASRAN